MYPNEEGARFDWTYYLDVHIPLVERELGPALKSFAIDRGLGGVEPGAPARFVAMAHLSFESMESFQAAFDPRAGEIMGDIPNFTSIEPIVQFSEVKRAH